MSKSSSHVANGSSCDRFAGSQSDNVDDKGDHTESVFIHSKCDAVQAARCIKLWQSYWYFCCETLRYTKTLLIFSGAGAQQSSFSGNLRQGLIHLIHINPCKNPMEPL